MREKKIKSTLASYLHACCLNPVITTFTRAIVNNNFIIWPGLTVNLINKHLTNSIHAYQGHMHVERKGLQSTKSKDKEKEEEMNSFPILDELNARVNYIYYTIINLNKTITEYLKLIGLYNGWLSL